MLRDSVVSGKFYPANETAINKQISSFLPKVKFQPTTAIAAIMPHAGYIYSGNVATVVASRLNIPKNVILLGPNHTGLGSNISMACKGRWRTPLGEVEINESLAQVLLNNSHLLADDEIAHSYEHSLEVELPILQYFKKRFKIVPIILGNLTIKEIIDLGITISKSIMELNIQAETLLIASTDMTHYEAESKARAKDELAIEQIKNLSANGLLETVNKNRISMCGVYPTAVVIEASKNLGAKKAKLIKYDTSATASGDRSEVVGYAGFIIDS